MASLSLSHELLFPPNPNRYLVTDVLMWPVNFNLNVKITNVHSLKLVYMECCLSGQTAQAINSRECQQRPCLVPHTPPKSNFHASRKPAGLHLALWGVSLLRSTSITLLRIAPSWWVVSPIRKWDTLCMGCCSNLLAWICA